jgi:hypothetical protein
MSLARSIRALIATLFASVSVAIVTTPAAAQTAITIENRFADVNGTRLHYLSTGEGDPVILPSRVRAEQPHVAPADVGAGADPYGDRAGPPGVRPIREAGIGT